MPWLRGNLHAHTTFSDGVKEPAQLVAAYEALGYDFLAITDHENWIDDRYWSAIPRVSSKLLLFHGIELNWPRFDQHIGKVSGALGTRSSARSAPASSGWASRTTRSPARGDGEDRPQPRRGRRLHVLCAHRREGEDSGGDGRARARGHRVAESAGAYRGARGDGRVLRPPPPARPPIPDDGSGRVDGEGVPPHS